MHYLQGHESPVRSLAYAPDGSWLASGDEAGTLCLWSLPATELLQSWNIGPGSIEALTFCPRGEPLAIATTTDVLALTVRRSLETGKVEAVAGRGPGVGRALAWHPTEDLLVTGGWDGQLHFSTATRAQRRAPLRLAASITAVAFSPDGKSLAVVGTSGMVTVLDTGSWPPRCQTKQPR